MSGLIYNQCVGAFVPKTDAGFQKFVGNAINVVTSGINIALQMMASQLTLNMMLGINALRCAVVSGADSIWYFIASAWWATRYVGQEGLVEDALDTAYPYICTCLIDVNEFATMFGGNEETAGVFSSCSEASNRVAV